ncbi:MAG: hypothetical protein ACRC30_04485 [Clostridium sp.]
MKYTKRRRIIKITLILGLGLLAFQGVFLGNLKSTRIRKLRREAEENIKRDEIDEAIRLYEEIEERGSEKAKEVDALNIYKESEELFEKGEFKLAEVKLNSVNEAILNKPLKEKIDVLQEKINREMHLDTIIIEVRELRKKNEYIKAKEKIEGLEKIGLDKKTLEDIKSIEIRLEEEHRLYKENLKVRFRRAVANLEKANADYTLWEKEMKEILSELQKNLSDKKLMVIREEHGRWKVSLEGLDSFKRKESIKRYVKQIIEKF